MEKVKLTPEQAEALEKERESWTDDTILQQHVERWYLQQRDHVLDSLHFTTLAKALYIGYEIEEPFKVGDWVTWEYRSTKYTGKILEISDNDVLTDVKGSIYGANQRFLKNEIRKATPEEIVAEKERRKWAAINRSVGDYHKGDIVMFENHADVVEFVELRHGPYLRDFRRYVDKNEIELVCPVEKRFDLKEAE